MSVDKMAVLLEDRALAEKLAAIGINMPHKLRDAEDAVLEAVLSEAEFQAARARYPKRAKRAEMESEAVPKRAARRSQK